ncbi:class E sortase [Streptomyces litchfieldiae]|uniref:Class E sortase n=1 Tax=Streptomyces litchfieldiae TaxID=3075543 RepID=A0ABU2MN96_9ACTN|nr:class E sortase [Streptomyces sp. DSM 44938]MDT0342129.1 class E sortase [Streptomyces sp. DSM 44938]
MPSSTDRRTPAVPEENEPDTAREREEERKPEPDETPGTESERAEPDEPKSVPDEPKSEPDEPEETETDAEADEPEPEPEPVVRPSVRRRRVAAAVSVFGELLITAGVILGLFVVYSLWWTNVIANQEAKRDSDAVRDSWAQGEDDGDDSTAPAEFDPEDGIGFLHVPAMTDADILVKEGIDLDILNGGVAGYYDEPVQSAMPWEEGNFSLAAHRDGHGAKFHNIHKIEEGDAIVFETKNTWYIYRAYAILPETSKYNTAVLDPIPEESGRTEAGQYITLTTCTPVYTSQHRYVVWGELVRTEHVNAERTPPEELRQADD